MLNVEELLKNNTEKLMLHAAKLEEHGKILDEHAIEIERVQNQYKLDKKIQAEQHRQVREDLHGIRNVMPHRNDIIDLTKGMASLAQDMAVIKSRRSFFENQWFYIFSAVVVLITTVYWFGGFSTTKQQDAAPQVQEEKAQVQELQKIEEELNKN